MSANPYQTPQELRLRQSDNIRLPHPIDLRGSMGVLDVVQTQALILRRRWPYGLALAVTYVAFVVTLSMLSPSTSFFGNTFLLLGLIVGPGILPFTLLFVCLRLRRESHRRTGIFAETQSKISDEGIRGKVRGEDVSVSWSSFSSFMESNRVILLFLKDSNNHLIVARSKLVDPGDWLPLLEFLRHLFPHR